MYETKTFSILNDRKTMIALAELSIYHEINHEGTWYYFNRLNVPLKMRNEGIAKQLLQQVSEWADQERINILLDINPYGDLDLRQLIALYMKFGFKQTLSTNTMIRRCVDVQT